MFTLFHNMWEMGVLSYCWHSIAWDRLNIKIIGIPIIKIRRSDDRLIFIMEIRYLYTETGPWLCAIVWQFSCEGIPGLGGWQPTWPLQRLTGAPLVSPTSVAVYIGGPGDTHVWRWCSKIVRRGLKGFHGKDFDFDHLTQCNDAVQLFC